jgi:excisionase family DNA binding protein
MENQKYLTVEEAAKQFQVSEFTIRRWIKDGSLRAAKIGKSWRIKQADLDAFYEKRVQEDVTE